MSTEPEAKQPAQVPVPRSDLEVLRDPLYDKALQVRMPALRLFAHDMPHLYKRKKVEIAMWLVRYHPERVPNP